jgi:hypothetical protein
VDEAARYECAVAVWTDNQAQQAAVEAAASVFNFGLRNFAYGLNELQGSQFVTANVTWVSRSQLLTRIAWPFASSKTLVLLKLRGDGVDSPLGAIAGTGKSVLMTFTLLLSEGIESTEIRTSGYAMDAVWLTFRGSGFKQDVRFENLDSGGFGFKQQEYTCMLMSIPPLHFQEWNLTATRSCDETWCNSTCHQNCIITAVSYSAVMICKYQCYVDFVNSNDGPRNISTGAPAINSSTIVCPALKWPFASGHVVPSLMYAGRIIPGIESPGVTLSPQWTHVTPQGILASHALLVILGL